MEKVKSLLDKKPARYFSIGPNDTLLEALDLMCTHQTEYLVVNDESNKFLGLLTWHELAKKLLESNRALRKLHVVAIMTTEMPNVDVNDTLEHCLLMMNGFGVHVLPIFENSIFRNVLSIDDILQEVVRLRSQFFDEEETGESAPKIHPSITKRII